LTAPWAYDGTLFIFLLPYFILHKLFLLIFLSLPTPHQPKDKQNNGFSSVFWIGNEYRIPSYLKKLKSIQLILLSLGVKLDNKGPFVVQEKWTLEKDE